MWGFMTLRVLAFGGFVCAAVPRLTCPLDAPPTGSVKQLERSAASQAATAAVATSSAAVAPPKAGAAEGKGAGSGKAWLAVGIPTFPRPNNVDYLGKVLASIMRELARSPRDPFRGQVKVVVMNNFGPGHVTFDRARQRYAGNPDFVFVDNPGGLVDPLGPEASDPGTPNKPGHRVRKQTRDLVAVLRASQGRAHHYLFHEDDMEFCPHALLAFRYLLGKAEAYHPRWIAVRSSYGMNGIFLHDEVGTHHTGPRDDIHHPSARR
jgi:hypothetical protein